MAATPNCQLVESAVLAAFPDARFGRYNCRHISSNAIKPWSQHAASEPARKYFSNALDIWHVDHKPAGKPADSSPAHQTWLRAVRAFITLNYGVLIDQMLGPGDNAAHANHIHMSTWPKMKSSWWYRPPCKDGTLIVIYEDGSTGDTFGDLPSPRLGDDMAFRRNDTGHSIAQMQKGLLGWNSDILSDDGADGVYGAETEAAVRAYQLAAQLDQVADTELGVCDGNTHNQLLEYVPDKVGSQGEQGEQGEPGVEGPQGDPGMQGIQGVDGIAGPQGMTGAPGPEGPSPVAGKITDFVYE